MKKYNLVALVVLVVAVASGCGEGETDTSHLSTNGQGALPEDDTAAVEQALSCLNWLSTHTVRDGMLPTGLVISCNGRYRLALQTDGNLVLYKDLVYPLWHTHTNGYGAGVRLRLQGDGNLVLYSQSGRALWATMAVSSNVRNQLIVQDDGNLVQYHEYYPGHWRAVWASNTRGR